jgi:hypothetical protein
MARKLSGRKELIEKMVPTDYAVGCRVYPLNSFQAPIMILRTETYAGERLPRMHRRRREMRSKFLPYQGSD